MTKAFANGGENELSSGLRVVLARQRAGFWGRLGDGPSHPEFSEDDVPGLIYTFEPWLGCLWGTSCSFCYVPNLSVRHFPGGHESGWFKDWGRWLVPKPEITTRLRHQLFDARGKTRPTYRGGFVFMSAKTDPYLPSPELLDITRANLKTFLEADVFLMCPTRSAAVVEDAEIFRILIQMAEKRKVGVSFSVGTDIKEEQRRIERGGLSPERRLRIMADLKSAGVFVSAAVSPLMPYSDEFPRHLLECAHHASIQLLRSIGFGSTTPKNVLTEVQGSIRHYRDLDRRLVEQLSGLPGAARFSWGIGNKGFTGAFLAARRFYGLNASHQKPSQQALV